MPHPTIPAVVRHPEAVAMVALDPAIDYPADDVLVKTYPQFFRKIENADKIIDSVSVETATAEPGQKRTRTKPAK